MSRCAPPAQRIELAGRVDINQARSLHQQALAALDGPGDVLVVWDAVESLDAAALQILLALDGALRAAGRSLTVTTPPEPVARTLALIGLSETFHQERPIP